jgi:hypothetical protein
VHRAGAEPGLFCRLDIAAWAARNEVKTRGEPARAQAPTSLMARLSAGFLAGSKQASPSGALRGPEGANLGRGRTAVEQELSSMGKKFIGKLYENLRG